MSKTPSVLLLPLALLLGATACADAMSPVGPEESARPATREEQFIALVNTHRQSVGCEPLEWHEDAAGIAERHSEDMVRRGYFGHFSPEGASPFDRLRQAGISYSRAAENIAGRIPSPQAVFSTWLDSAGHRRNIEDCAYTHHGVGEHESYWTHLFLTPR